MRYELNFEVEPLVSSNEFSGKPGQELDLETTLSGLNATLTWLPTNSNPSLYTWQQARDNIYDKGAYIAVRVGPGGSIEEILKVGVTGTPFRERINKGDEHARLRAAYPTSLRYFFAKIAATNACPVRGCGTVVEHLIVRTLLRAGWTINERHHESPFARIRTTGEIRIANILPKQLRPSPHRSLSRAYAATGTDPRGQRVTSVSITPVPRSTLSLSTGTRWELDS